MTLSIPHIHDEFTTVIVDSINLRQSLANPLPFITISEDVAKSIVNIYSTGVEIGEYDLSLESFDASSEVKATLKTDLVKVTVALKYLEFSTDLES